MRLNTNEISNYFARVLEGVTGLGPAVAEVNKIFARFYPSRDEDDPIFKQLFSDSTDLIFHIDDIDSILAYIKTNNDTIQQIKQAIIDFHEELGGYKVVESDDSTIVHIIIDYLCSNGVDFSDRKYNDLELKTHLYTSCYAKRPEGLEEPQDVSNVAETVFKEYVPQLSIKDFEDSLNKGGLFGLFVPVYSGDETPYVPYDPAKGRAIKEAMPIATQIIQTKLLNIYNQISVRKLLQEYDNLMVLQKNMQLTEEQNTRLKEIEPIVQTARYETDEMRKRMLAPFIQKQAERIAGQALLGLGVTGGKKRTLKSKKHRKTRSKKSKTNKKSKKSRK
jgi:hypothetical protein